MFIDDLLDFLMKYKQAYPHRNIEIRGELDLHREGEMNPTKVKLDNSEVFIPLQPVSPDNEIPRS